MTLNNSNIAIHPSLETDQDFCQDWHLLDLATINDFNLVGQLEQYVNGKGLACPMPLLKLKMALKTTAIGNSVYLTATDPNSTRDIGAFCHHSDYNLWQQTTTPSDEKSDTIFHSIITKNC